MNEVVNTNSEPSRQVQKHRLIHQKPHYIDIRSLFDFAIFDSFGLKSKHANKILYMIVKYLPNFKGNKDIAATFWFGQKKMQEETGVPRNRITEVFGQLRDAGLIEEFQKGSTYYRAFSSKAIKSIKLYENTCRKSGDLVTMPGPESGAPATLPGPENGFDGDRKTVMTGPESGTKRYRKDKVEIHNLKDGEKIPPPVDKKITKSSLIGAYQALFSYCSKEVAEAAIAKCEQNGVSRSRIRHVLDEIEMRLAKPHKSPDFGHARDLLVRCQQPEEWS